MVLEALWNKARAEHLKTIYYQNISNTGSIWKETIYMFNKDCVWWQCEKCTPRSVEKLFPFKNTDTVIEYYQWEKVIFGKMEKNNYRTATRWWKWALLKKSLNIWLLYLLTSVSITSQTSISSKISNRQRKTWSQINWSSVQTSVKIIVWSIKMKSRTKNDYHFFCATVHYQQDGKPATETLCFMLQWLNTWQKCHLFIILKKLMI